MVGKQQQALSALSILFVQALISLESMTTDGRKVCVEKPITTTTRLHVSEHCYDSSGLFAIP